MTDYRKLQRQGAALLVRLHNAGALDYGAVTDDDVFLICKLSEIPKPGNPNLPKTGGKRPGAGRKKKITEAAK